MRKHGIISIILLTFFALIGWYFFFNEMSANRPFRYGLDLVGGTELVYRADTSGVEDANGAMETLKEVIERRVNIFGVSEPLVQTERAGLVSGNSEDRLIVELPGVKDLDRAVALIGETPVLEIRLARPDFQEIAAKNPRASLDELFIPTGLTGRYLSRAQVEFNGTTGTPVVGLEFNNEGKDLFAKITREHKGEGLAVILDGG